MQPTRIARSSVTPKAAAGSSPLNIAEQIAAAIIAQGTSGSPIDLSGNGHFNTVDSEILNNTSIDIRRIMPDKKDKSPAAHAIKQFNLFCRERGIEQTGFSLLGIAARMGNLQSVQNLVTAGASPSIQGASLSPPMCAPVGIVPFFCALTALSRGIPNSLEIARCLMSGCRDMAELPPTIHSQFKSLVQEYFPEIYKERSDSYTESPLQVMFENVMGGLNPRRHIHRQ